MEKGRQRILASYAEMIFRGFFLFLSFCALPTLLTHSTLRALAKAAPRSGGKRGESKGTGRLGKLNKMITQEARKSTPAG